MASESTALVERPGATEIVRTPHDDISLVPAQAERDPYIGIAQIRFTEKQQEILTKPCDLAELDVLPTGEVYLSQVGYRRRLNEAFGVGGWAMRPMTPVTVSGSTLMREWALYAEARFISSAWGEAEYQERNSRHSYATAAEALKSNAIMRCCKDLGIASECWDRRFTQQFKKDHCVKVWREKAKHGQGEYQWRRKDADPFYDEGKGRKGQQCAPENVDTETGEEREPTPDTSSPKLEYITGKQQKELITAARESGWTGEALAGWLKTSGYREWSKVPALEFSKVMAIMQGGTGAGD